MEDKKCSRVIKHPSSSCSAELLARLATSPFEHCSKGEQSRVAEHANTCSACSAILAHEHKLEEMMHAFASPERYPDEPELNLLSVIQQVREQEHQASNTQLQRKEHKRIWQAKPLALLLVVCSKAITTIIRWLLGPIKRDLLITRCLLESKSRREKGDAWEKPSKWFTQRKGRKVR
jgi:hypothetical protein